MNKRFRRMLSVMLTGVLLILCGCDEQVSDSALFTQSSTLQTHATSTTTTTTAESTTITTTTQTTTVETTVDTETTQSLHIDRDGSYTTKEDVSLYLYIYGELPQNFITKKEAQALGWEGGSLEPYAPGCCIGGSYFGNYEGLLPEESGRSYYECDIDTLGKSSRGAKRIVYSNDGLIYYTADHYEHFTLLYGDPEE
ncbi:MAG: ribonuclease domain-containing protein [Oscillospiraceae bacterium]|nr:ribonuclease domain-containing protein [Oscillospiraceae bacterium]